MHRAWQFATWLICSDAKISYDFCAGALPILKTSR
jgi:hypothetical protein